MNLWAFLTVVVLAGMVSKVVEAWMKSRSGAAASSNAGLAELEHRVAQLEDQRDPEGLEARVQALEAIVVGGDVDDPLAREFEALEREEREVVEDR